MLKVKVGEINIDTVPYKITMTPEDYVEFQLRLILGKKAENLSKGELKVLSYMYLYPNIVDAINQITGVNIRTSKKSVQNDLSKFKDLEILNTENSQIIFNEKIKIKKEPEYYLIKVNF